VVGSQRTPGGQEGLWHRHYYFIALFGAAEAALAVRIGFEGNTLWLAPIVVALFFVAHRYDIRVPGSTSRMSFDYAIALPAVVLFQNPFLVGLMAAAGYLLSRIYVRGIKGVRATLVFDALNMALSFTLAGMLLRHLTEGLTNDAPLWILLLALTTVAWGLINLAGYLMDRLAVGTPITLEWVGKYLLLLGVWYPISVPFMILVVTEIRHHRPFQLAIATLPLLIVVWVLRLYSNMEQKNARQEFLRQLTLAGAVPLDKEAFLTDLLGRLREFVPWDRELLVVLPDTPAEEPTLITLGDLPTDLPGVKARLIAMLDDPGGLIHTRPGRKVAFTPLLAPEARGQLVIPLATSQVAFGILAVERTMPEAFRKDERQFLELAFAQIARDVEEEILKKQLLRTNRRLVQQAEHLSQILEISNLLKVHLDVQGILERVAHGIRDSMGFSTVLVSLYHEEEGFFERIAQAGVDERWEEIRAVRPPSQEILCLLQEKYRVGTCYLIRHTEDTLSPYDVVPLNPRVPVEPDDWDPLADMLIVPLMDKDQRLLGILSVDEPADGKLPSPEVMRALEILANQTVHALESAQVHAHIKHQAVMDGLTGLYNHGYFQEALAQKARESAMVGRPYTVLMMDLDNLKEVNDTFGHLLGDEVLRAVADTLSASIRKEDVAARYGGDEFAVFLPDRTVEQAEQVAERIRTEVEAIRIQPGISASARPIRVTLSVGIASHPQNGIDHHEVMKAADEALYEAKRTGKNRVCMTR
jgi:diguanylate cyclase (GGDEF)-like protein